MNTQYDMSYDMSDNMPDEEILSVSNLKRYLSESDKPIEAISKRYKINYSEISVSKLRSSKMIGSSLQDKKYLKTCKNYLCKLAKEPELLEDILPPFILVLHKQVDIHTPDHEMKNAKLLHQASFRKLNREFEEKKKVYSKIVKQIQLTREFYLRGRPYIPLDILRYIVMFL